MNTEQRLNLISKIAYHSRMQPKAAYELSDMLWIIGMISDSTMSEHDLDKEIESIKEQYPELLTY